MKVIKTKIVSKFMTIYLSCYKRDNKINPKSFTTMSLVTMSLVTMKNNHNSFVLKPTRTKIKMHYSHIKMIQQPFSILSHLLSQAHI